MKENLQKQAPNFPNNQDNILKYLGNKYLQGTTKQDCTAERDINKYKASIESLYNKYVHSQKSVNTSEPDPFFLLSKIHPILTQSKILSEKMDPPKKDLSTIFEVDDDSDQDLEDYYIPPLFLGDSEL